METPRKDQTRGDLSAQVAVVGTFFMGTFFSTLSWHPVSWLPKIFGSTTLSPGQGHHSRDGEGRAGEQAETGRGGEGVQPGPARRGHDQ